MSKLDPRYAQLHKEVYGHMLDELDTAIVQEIMSNPSCAEAQLLNQRVDAEIRRRIEALSTVQD